MPESVCESDHDRILAWPNAVCEQTASILFPCQTEMTVLPPQANAEGVSVRHAEPWLFDVLASRPTRFALDCRKTKNSGDNGRKTVDKPDYAAARLIQTRAYPEFSLSLATAFPPMR
ncbi:MAG: hypothetical protein LBU43_10360 [Candidatus Accumulibacter sp.]|jgi:hypothetical protein|nr:hypothetical protein [Accumulibacter sp.]